MIKFIGLCLVLLMCGAPGRSLAQSSIDRIVARDKILIGTTGDFKPFTYLNPETGTYEGYDIDAAYMLGTVLGVDVEFVPTTWKTLEQGILEGRYDLAMGGITRTINRMVKVGMTEAYFTVGKSPLIRRIDRTRFKSLAEIDQPGIKIGVNPGGTNEKFVRENISRATIIVVDKNLEIPGKVANGEVDVMFTDNVEAILYASAIEGLYAAFSDKPLTSDDFGYLTARNDQAFINLLNLWIHKLQTDGSFKAIRQKWIGE